MQNIINGIKYGISYFTVLPIKVPYFEANKEFYRGVLFSLPIVGSILALIVILLFLFIPMPILYKSILVAILYPFLYGFLHLEAVADTIDAIFASYSNKDIYQIIKEPQIGSIGAIGVFCFILLKIIAIGFLLYYHHFLAIFIAFIFSRYSVLFALDFDYHKDSTFINSLKNSYQLKAQYKIIFFPIYFFTRIILEKLQKRLGFLNGDTLGFSIELQEIIYLNIAIFILSY
jgi:adenosylcobinamide-GDP ribazoletransferase